MTHTSLRLFSGILCIAALTLGEAQAQSSTLPRDSTRGAPGARIPSTNGTALDLPIVPPRFKDYNTVNLPGLTPRQNYDLNLPTPPMNPTNPGDTPNPSMTGDPTDNPGDTPDPTDMGDPPPTFFGEPIETESGTIFYVVDRSGSMSRDQQSFVNMDDMVVVGSKMDRSKSEIIRSITGLSENFSFNIISYNCTTSMWTMSLQRATDDNKQLAIAWVMELEAGGRTGTGPANALALSDKENMSVVLLTDGAPNCGANGFQGHREMIARENSQGATINVFGIAASGDYRSFCQAVAGDSGGAYYDVP